MAFTMAGWSGVKSPAAMLRGHSPGGRGRRQHSSPSFPEWHTACWSHLCECTPAQALLPGCQAERGAVPPALTASRRARRDWWRAGCPAAGPWWPDTAAHRQSACVRPGPPPGGSRGQGGRGLAAGSLQQGQAGKERAAGRHSSLPRQAVGRGGRGRGGARYAAQPPMERQHPSQLTPACAAPRPARGWPGGRPPPPAASAQSGARPPLPPPCAAHSAGRQHAAAGSARHGAAAAAPPGMGRGRGGDAAGAAGACAVRAPAGGSGGPPSGPAPGCLQPGTNTRAGQKAAHLPVRQQGHRVNCQVAPPLAHVDAGRRQRGQQVRAKQVRLQHGQVPAAGEGGSRGQGAGGRGRTSGRGRAGTARHRRLLQGRQRLAPNPGRHPRSSCSIS